MSFASSRFKTATHIVAVVCFNADKLTTSEMVATSVGTSGPVVRRLLAALCNAGILSATMGRSGGYVLAKQPKAISLNDILQAVDDEEIFRSPSRAPSENCPVGSRIHQVLEEPIALARAKFERQLSLTTVWSLMKALEAT
jgi:Rrf2 family protein